MVCVTSGANMNFDRLRMVSELAGVGARREAMLATTIPEVYRPSNPPLAPRLGPAQPAHPRWSFSAAMQASLEAARRRRQR